MKKVLVGIIVAVLFFAAIQLAMSLPGLGLALVAIGASGAWFALPAIRAYLAGRKKPPTQ